MLPSRLKANIVVVCPLNVTTLKTERLLIDSTNTENFMLWPVSSPTGNNYTNMHARTQRLEMQLK